MAELQELLHSDTYRDWILPNLHPDLSSSDTKIKRREAARLLGLTIDVMDSALRRFEEYHSSPELEKLREMRDLIPVQRRLLAHFAAELGSSLTKRSEVLGDIENRITQEISFQWPAWVEESILEMRHLGLLVGYPDGLHEPRKPTRYEWAVATYAIVVHIKKGLAAHGHLSDQMTNEQLSRKYAPVLARLTKEFAYELTTLGVDVPAMLGTLAWMSAK